MPSDVCHLSYGCVFSTNKLIIYSTEIYLLSTAYDNRVPCIADTTENIIFTTSKLWYCHSCFINNLDLAHAYSWGFGTQRDTDI